jgi:hypothetical protein
LKKKAVIILVFALMLFNASARLNLVHSISNGMCMDPVAKVVDPPMDGSDLTFTWNLNISTSIAVSAWEAIILWDPSVLNAMDVKFGTFMTPGSVVSNYTYPPMPQTVGKLLTLGQLYNTQGYTSTGDGLLATIKFTFILPGVTTLYIIEAKVWDDSLNEYNLMPPTGDTLNGQLSSNRPHPIFVWTTDDGINPVPNQTIYYAGRSLSAGTVVHFNGSLSYDVGNVYWDGSKWVRDGGYPDIVKFRWEYGDGKYDVYGTVYGNFSKTTNYTYTAYNKADWLVNLTVWDSEGEWWSSTWRYGGPEPSNRLKMWRDVAVVDIWPWLPQYYLWDEYGTNSIGNWESSDCWLPNTGDNYWNYHLPPCCGQPQGTTASSWGLFVLVIANNYGSVPEKVTVRLYAQYLREGLKIVPPPPKARFATGVEKIGEWNNDLQPVSGSNWNDQCKWFPAKNGTYLLFATIEAQDGVALHDGNPDNNYIMLSTPICNIAVWDKATLTLKTDSIFTQYRCDIDGNGKVGAEDFALLSANFGAKPPK